MDDHINSNCDKKEERDEDYGHADALMQGEVATSSKESREHFVRTLDSSLSYYAVGERASNTRLRRAVSMQFCISST